MTFWNEQIHSSKLWKSDFQYIDKTDLFTAFFRGVSCLSTQTTMVVLCQFTICVCLEQPWVFKHAVNQLTFLHYWYVLVVDCCWHWLCSQTSIQLRLSRGKSVGPSHLQMSLVSSIFPLPRQPCCCNLGHSCAQWTSGFMLRQRKYFGGPMDLKSHYSDQLGACHVHWLLNTKH